MRHTTLDCPARSVFAALIAAASLAGCGGGSGGSSATYADAAGVLGQRLASLLQSCGRSTAAASAAESPYVEACFSGQAGPKRRRPFQQANS